MKKIIALVLALALVGSSVAGVFWYTHIDTQPVFPDPAPGVAGFPLYPTHAHTQVPLLGGLWQKEGDYNYGTPDIALSRELPLQAPFTQIPEGYTAAAQVFLDGQLLYDGPMQDLGEAHFSTPGSYEIIATLTNEQGILDYSVSFQLLPTPEPPPPPLPPAGSFVAGRTTLQQGDIFSFMYWGLPENVEPQVDTDLGMAICTPMGGGNWYCAIPVSNVRNPGTYGVRVTAGELREDVEILVESFTFDEQNLIIDVTDPVIGEANSPAAYQQYRETIPPLFETYDEEIYWEGTFIQPVEGRISTPFGAIRYTNSDFDNPSFHWGLDIAAPKGTPVVAPNNGRVVLAEKLLNTGNTLVIEHGGGLKSYYFHMNALSVSQGDQVTKGQQVGEVGSTGYSTGPHLHFETRIGKAAVSPPMLFSPEGGLYSALEKSMQGPIP